MPLDTPYSVVVAPAADEQVAAATRWWRANRPAAPDLLRDELGALLLLVAERPDIGRRVHNRRFGRVRVLVLHRTRYLVYYQVLAATREVRVVHFRRGQRRPLRLL